MARGRFITIEGIEGVGKTSNVDYLAGEIERRGQVVLATREPGGTPTAERIRGLLIEHGDEAMPVLAELLLMFAARSIHVENLIRPALEAGTWVICDRFSDASRAYQGGGRGLPMEDIDLLADRVHGDLVPDVTILLDAPVEVGMARAGRRSGPDRFESERAEFFERVRQTYLRLAQAEPDRFIVVDANRSPDAVRGDLDRVISGLFNL